MNKPAAPVRAARAVATLTLDECKRRGLTQSQLAGLTATPQKWITGFGGGRVDPPISIALKMLAG